ncbi:MAG: protein-L-isoaspartate O-methyltransferase, partial [Hyphomicrobiales bacterium]
MTDFALARDNMIESQVRPNGVTDHRIIDSMAGIARENFVP